MTVKVTGTKHKNLRISSGATWGGIYNGSDQKQIKKNTTKTTKRNFIRIKTNY